MKPEQKRALQRALAGLVDIVSFVDHKGHVKMTVQHGERIKVFSVAGTPKNLDHCISEVVRDVKRFVKGQYQ